MPIKSGYLDWDSEFFNKRIAFVEGFNASDDQVTFEIKKFLNDGSDCVYLFTRKPIETNDIDKTLVDIKRTYILQKPQFKELKSSLSCQMMQHDDEPSGLYSLAIQSGEHSRFKLDPNFSEEDFQRLYHTWIDNSIKEGFSDYVFVVDKNNPKGFITAKIKDNYIVIGLFATDSTYRGQGIGSMLMQQIINIASIKGYKVKVITQAENEGACRFYEHKGFLKSDDQYVYHIWCPHYSQA